MNINKLSSAEQLREEQKELAADYADSLELYLEEEESDGTTN